MDREETGRPPLREGLVLGAHWGFLAFFAGYGGYYLLSLVLSAAVPGSGGGSPDLPALGPIVLLAFVPNLLLGLAPVLGSRRWGRGLRADFGLVPNGRDVKVGLAAGGFALLAGYVLNLLLFAVYGTGPVTSPLTDIVRGAEIGLGWLVVVALVVVVAAPLTEELLVRGALWNALASYRLPPWVVLVLTSLVFAQLHGEPERVVSLFGQGLAIGAARMITGRVGTSVVAHAANNAPAALALLVGS
ncbi:hypothetical protein B0I33_104205 [Prauserella shujinwangii]|uniref:CAAX prenyl protease 2/Lysostaphin resistance protein A-like domain-containing protein n=1 Tax=Prauserella shujinwangii TaxID=1453103 RepID=A0A2T0LWP7_9PSEU|nr:CPBP family intramembrane glutamic endopeptidase [Prauserella shujinwangii]PRX48389.1 hypothetical protein B0I33_104205 [Prauserella shujinwangii]